MYLKIFFFITLLIFNYFIFKFFLIKASKFNQNKINSVIGIRWGNSEKSHFGGIIFFINISLVFLYFFFYEKLYDLNNINLDQKRYISLYLSLLVAFISYSRYKTGFLPLFVLNKYIWFLYSNLKL